ncbi:MAG: hypothetical protein SynsKO_14080 [Synoicihabitans sp.]
MKTTEPKPTCSRCGIETNNHMGDVVICDECYIIRGSCCPEFDPDDLSKMNAPPTND